LANDEIIQLQNVHAVYYVPVISLVLDLPFRKQFLAHEYWNVE
jgi:hypothetical protein